MKIRTKWIVLVWIVVATAACGGGSSKGPSKYPLLSALTRVTVNGSTFTLTAKGTVATQAVDGLCSGTLTQTISPANMPDTFEGAAVLSATVVGTLTFTNCSPPSSTGTEIDYYDSQYVPLGVSIVGGNYGIYASPPTIPETVMAGDTGTIGTINYFTDNTKTVGAGHADLSFAVEEDSSSSVIVNSISKVYDAAGNLTSTSQSRVRIDDKGNLTMVSQDVQYAFTSTNHLVFR